jgi:hypothetical protein
MSINHLSDKEIEILLFGKWRFNTNWEKISIQFRDDMTSEQTLHHSSLSFLPKPL